MDDECDIEEDEYDIEEDDATRIDIFALFVLENVPIAMINGIMQKPYDDLLHNYLWLADSYDNLPELPQSRIFGRTRPQVDEQWRSPFIGRTVQEAADFVRNVPKPPKALSKSHFVCMEKDQYEKRGWLTVCKIVDDEVQSLSCVADDVADFLVGYDRDTWEESLRIWMEDGVPRMG